MLIHWFYKNEREKAGIMQQLCDESISKIIPWQERIVLSLRALFEQYGYEPFRMGKFEEYDLYANAKDFLVSSNIITFSDTDGKLLALKPDVTLSIIKNSSGLESGVTRLYYSEHVYRTAKGSPFFKELMQVGLECLGRIDDYCRYEVTLLAAKSLLSISPSAVLDVSHLGILQEIICRFGLSKEVEDQLFTCIRQKNLHELRSICGRNGVDAEDARVLAEVAGTYGRPLEVLERLRSIDARLAQTSAFRELESLAKALAASACGDIARIDLSVATGSAYYNGIVFEGFVEGVPERVLSGGQYDQMMRKMGHDSSAIGFAVYLDTLERRNEEPPQRALDVLLVYDETCDAAVVGEVAERLNAEGKQLLVLQEECLSACDLTCETLVRIRDNKVVTCDD